MSAASAMKMSYAGITKGTQALGAAMLLAATRGGTADALFAELSSSQPQMLPWLKRSLALLRIALRPALAGPPLVRVGALTALVAAGLAAFALLALAFGVADWRSLLGRLRRQPA